MVWWYVVERSYRVLKNGGMAAVNRETKGGSE